MLIDHGAAVDLGRNEVNNHDHLLTFGWSFGCGFIAIHASTDLVLFYHNIIPSSCIVVMVHMEKGRQYI
jgi:hypothetical protein